jgi:EAL domain-containing protein (putative c-di-GMP-specific phosphodiesterase class I)
MSAPLSPVPASTIGWELEGDGVSGERLRLTVARLPWRIGRDADNELVLRTGGISRHHAELRVDGQGNLRLLDHDSRNGSYVNGLRVIGSSAPLVGGELLHLGSVAFKLHAVTAPLHASAAQTEPASPLALLRQPSKAAALQALLQGLGLAAAWQPLCATEGGRAWGGELLGRADHPQLPEDPLPLLDLAAQLRCEGALSEAWRAFGVARLAASGLLGAAHEAPEAARPPVFLNLHPREPLDERLLDRLQLLADAHPRWQFVVELQPARLLDEDLPGFVQLLEVVGLQWGVEQLSRLSPEVSAALVALRPDYLKLAPRLVRRLRPGDAGHVRLMVKWQTLAEALGASLVAVGVERRETLEMCRTAGLSWVQGYLTGAPRRLRDGGAI